MKLPIIRSFDVVLILVIIGLIIILVGTFYYFNGQLSYLKKNNNQSTSQQVQAAQLVDKLSKIYDVPTDETPTIVDINNPDALRSQPFFAKAQKGDELFIYLKNQKAILYDPVNNKIVNVDTASITQSNNQSQK